MLRSPHTKSPFCWGIFLYFVFCSAGLSQSVAEAPPHQRVLPLNRFPDSRAAGTDDQGFYLMPTAIGDDYFDGTDPPERVERHLRTAQLAGVKYLRCAFSWNGIEPQRGVYKWQFWDDLVSRA